MVDPRVETVAVCVSGTNCSGAGISGRSRLRTTALSPGTVGTTGAVAPKKETS